MTKETAYAQAERHANERRAMHEEAMELSRVSTVQHSRRINGLVVAALLRPLIEAAILVVLIVKF